ncbi:MAG: hemerythrin domain-containing protein [Nitrososphaeraceae archaeon]
MQETSQDNPLISDPNCMATVISIEYIFLRVTIRLIMTSVNRIDFNEPVPEMIARLKSEHTKFGFDLAKIKTSIKNDNATLATEIIQGMSDKIIRHAVEEEARLMRVIMHKAKEESTESVRIMQEHNWVMNFPKNRMIIINKTATSSNPDEHEQVKNDLNEFVYNLRNHFNEEEQIVFPLALKAEASD